MRTSALAVLSSLALVGCASWAAGTEADSGNVTRIVVTSDVVASEIEPIGANLTTIVGGTNLATNNLIAGSGMEPGVARYLIRVEDAGRDWISWRDSLGGVSMWDQNARGFGDGAEVRFYRLVDDAGRPLVYPGDGMVEASDARNVAFLGTATVAENGWRPGSGDEAGRVYLDGAPSDLTYGDHAIVTVTKYRLEGNEVHPRLHEWFEHDSGGFVTSEGATAYLVPHTGALPAGFAEPGRGALRAEFPRGGGWIGQWRFHGYDDGEGLWYSQLEPGKRYRAEVWLRQEGVARGEVSFYVGGAYEGSVEIEPWQVDDEWRKYTVDFTGPPYLDPPTYHGLLGLRVHDSGTVWVDNFVVYLYDEEHDYRPFTPHHIAFNELMRAMPAQGPKPAVRFYPVTYQTHATADRLLSNYLNGRIDFIYNVRPSEAAFTIPHAMEWAYATGDDARNRVVPIVTLSEEYTELEWLAVAEYLGAPFDPEVDDRDAKPWAYRRYLHRGHGRPWTDEFREIVLEIGNETWHAGVFAGWDGFGQPGWVNFGGREYGLFARHYLVEHVMAQPWWEEGGLTGRLVFALNASYEAHRDAYGELAARQFGDVFTYLGHANYVGPTWETGNAQSDVFDDRGMWETLAGAYTGMFPLIEQVAKTRSELLAEGAAAYRPFAYEGGPSGYFIPGNGTERELEASERYGKSLAMAVSALDAWLYSSLHGYAHQAFLGFAGGEYWSSHTVPLQGGFRPHTGWLALTMRNRYAAGTEMLRTQVVAAPTRRMDGRDVPLISAYTFRGADSLSVFVLSRHLEDPTPVAIELPDGDWSRVTRYALTSPDGTAADPRANNVDAMNVIITEQEVEPTLVRDGVLLVGPETGGLAGGMAPGTVYLYVLEREPTQ